MLLCCDSNKCLLARISVKFTREKNLNIRLKQTLSGTVIECHGTTTSNFPRGIARADKVAISSKMKFIPVLMANIAALMHLRFA